MTLSFGRQFLAIPGPTTVPDEVLQAMHRPAIDIYAGELEGITESVRADMKRVFRSETADIYLYIANGHGAWEAALANTLSRGDKVLVLESGKFALGWGDMAIMMGAEVEVLPGKPQGSVDPSAVEARLRADAGHEIKAILVVQIDTASGVINDIAAIRGAIDAAGHPALFMVDGIASIGCVPFEMDAWGVDLALTGSQKGLMTPPGMSFVAAGPRAKAAAPTADMKTFYWDWDFREGELHYQKYCGTPPEHLLFGLRRALDMLLNEEGLETAWRRHALLAGATRVAIDVWGEGGVLSCRVPDPAERSDTVTTVSVGGGRDSAELRRFTQEVCGVTLGVGIGDLSENMFRVAHMGHVNAPMMLGALSTIDLGLKSLGWAHGSGAVEAAIAHLATATSVANDVAAE
ncbi:MAG: aminotransferase class V-fold PLP-dependent enzyme [Pseudomonadota bacterium]